MSWIEKRRLVKYDVISIIATADHIRNYVYPVRSEGIFFKSIHF